MTSSYLKLNWSKFFSVSNPYSEDDFIKSNSSAAELEEFDPFEYYLFLKNSILEKLVKSISRQDALRAISFIDAGVYMGSFSIAAYLICREEKIKCDIQAVEGMPRLIASIRKNFELYDAKGIRLCNNILGGEDAKLMKIGSRKGDIIGATAFNPEDKAGARGEIYEVGSISLATLVCDLQDGFSIVKLDIEGNEVSAFRSLTGLKMASPKVVYIIEFAPWQAKHIISGTETYGEFLLSRFHIFNIVNWESSCSSIDRMRLESLADLAECVSNKRSFNTDLLLIPHGLNLEL